MGRPEIDIESGADPEFDSEGGDSACWLDRMCPECGRIFEGGDHSCAPEAAESG